MTTATMISPAIEITDAQPTARMNWTRDDYGALHVYQECPGVNRTALGRAHAAILRVIAELEAGNADEHLAPAWQTGIAWDRKHNAGQAVNANIYGLMIFQGQALGVVQVRQWTRSRYQARHGFGGTVRKNWFLVGRNEGTGRPFAHAIDGRVVTRYLRNHHMASPENLVRVCLSWIWGVGDDRLKDILRHGDVALIPVPLMAVPDEVVAADPAVMRIIDNHVLVAAEMRRDGDRLFARNPLLQHQKGQHADVQGSGWFRVQVGARAEFWPFAKPTAD